ncbi:ABC transporter permease [Pseudochrobactrum kiredjianiae]|uniref:ABC transporter permease n=1 Tax=Pseudochrobactrum kiredjianiae TaxID=386305 RepID=A0ABW3V139_9HYPH|nr:ABC transporter permease [Pseudochrobactrum kiredjianiae]MDM7852632.1 ABC transporter permease [Pseudochrobactrum kiredjianiae]
MRIELIKRPQPSRWFSALSPLIALALAMICGAILFALMGKDPFAALHAFFIEPLLDIWSIHELLVKAAPLILIAVGLSVCYLSNNWNIGAEGQLTMGAIAGSMMPIVFPDVQGWYVLPLMLLMGMAGGALYAAIPALLKVRFNANTILTSLMLVYVAQFFLDWLVRGPWRNPAGMNFPESRQFHDYAILPEIWSASGRAHWGFVFAIIAAFALWFMLRNTLQGFQIKVVGQSPRAARFAGFSAGKITFFAFLLSGALAGLAGISEVSGAIGQLRTTITPGYGFTAIIIAFLGRLNPLGIIAAGLVLALSYLGGEAAQLSIGISEKAARVFQGMILFFVLACDSFIHYRIRFVSRSQHDLRGEA